MNMKEAAEKLNGSQYREEGSRELFREMKESNLVAVFGASDDLVELSGAIGDECGGPGKIHFDPIKRRIPVSDCTNDCPYFEEKLAEMPFFEAVWCETGKDCSWSYIANFPHETFNVYEDDELYCIGIVFDLNHWRIKCD